MNQKDNFDSRSQGLKRTFAEHSASTSANGIDNNSTPSAQPERKKSRQNDVSDILVRQKVLSALVRSQTRTPEDTILQTHIETCEDAICSNECVLGKKCLQHFSKCQKADCMLCVEARLIQAIESCADGNEDEMFRLQALRSRLLAINEEIVQYVPYFNSCAEEVLMARSTKSPFLQSAVQRFRAAKVLVGESEKKCSLLCGEIFQKWLLTLENNNHSDISNQNIPSRDGTPVNSNGSTSSAIQKQNSPISTPTPSIQTTNPNWQQPAQDRAMRTKMLEKIFIWFRHCQQGSNEIKNEEIYANAKKIESKLYFSAKTKEDYEDESTLMSRLLDA